MEFLNNSIIICNDSIKKNILKKNFAEKKLFNYTFLSLPEFQKRYYFELTDEAIIYSANFLGFSYENTKEIIDSLYYICENEKYEDEKLKQLQKLKQELKIKGLLKYDLLFKNFIADKKIYLVDMFLNKFQKNMFATIENVEVLNADITEKDYVINKFNYFDEEVDYVFAEITKLLNDGFDINKIVIINLDKSYRHLIRRYSSLYKIAIDMKEQESIINHKMVKHFLSLVLDGVSKKEIFEIIKEYNNDYIYAELLKLVNQFYFVENNRLLFEILSHEIKNIKYEHPLLKDAIRVENSNYIPNEDECVFIVGFNDNSFPQKFSDDNYLEEKYCSQLPLDTLVEKNSLEIKKGISYLSGMNNLMISFAINTDKNNVVSSLVDYMNVTINTPKINLGLVKERDAIHLGVLLDEYYNYSVEDENIKILQASIENEYKKYSNKFSEIDINLLSEKLANVINLSYSSISKYYKCQFAYYLEYVLKVRIDKPNQSRQIGTIFHEILQKYGTEGFNLEEEKQKQYAEISSPSLKFYFEKLWPDFAIAIEAIEEFKNDTMLKDEMHEKEIIITVQNGKYLNVFKGFIDKFIYTTIDGVDYTAIIDYKTGQATAAISDINYGFDLQLPIYAYLLVKSKLLENPKIIGLYLQHILSKPTLKKGKDVLDCKKEDLKLDGYSTSKVEDLKLLDYTYAKSKYIKAMSVNKDQSFNRYAKVLNDDEFNGLINKVEELISNAFDKIAEGKFEINPKLLNGKNKSCEYCEYANICYKTNKDYVLLDEKGGE